jgi:YD repeat-containing protein
MAIAPISSDLIRVGYISKTEGYIKGLTVAQANTYEKSNPNTLYIFQNGDGVIQYLNINQVNALTVKDLLRSETCVVTPRPCTSPLINFFGGDGIGAEGNAIIDKNGVILAVDIVNGGYGYSRRPLAQVIDPCDNGSGALLDTEIKDGRVVRVIVLDGGTGYLPPPQTAPQYPALLQLKDVIVRRTGINYNCGVDEITVCIDRNGTTVTEPNGTVLSYQCDPFGRIRQVQVVRGGTFSENIRICVHSTTGVNAELIPIFDVIRDPVFVEKEKDLRNVIQVYDLIGLTVQGYVDGKPYYGRVYFENDTKFAGVPGTGKPIPVYETRTESVQKASQNTRGDSVRILGAVETGTTESVITQTPTTNTPTTLNITPTTDSGY